MYRKQFINDREELQLMLEGAHSQAREDDRKRRVENHAISIFHFPPLGRWFDEERERMSAALAAVKEVKP